MILLLIHFLIFIFLIIKSILYTIKSLNKRITFKFDIITTNFSLVASPFYLNSNKLNLFSLFLSLSFLVCFNLFEIYYYLCQNIGLEFDKYSDKTNTKVIINSYKESVNLHKKLHLAIEKSRVEDKPVILKNLEKGVDSRLDSYKVCKIPLYSTKIDPDTLNFTKQVIKEKGIKFIKDDYTSALTPRPVHKYDDSFQRQFNSCLIYDMHKTTNPYINIGQIAHLLVKTTAVCNNQAINVPKDNYLYSNVTYNKESSIRMYPDEFLYLISNLKDKFSEIDIYLFFLEMGLNIEKSPNFYRDLCIVMDTCKISLSNLNILEALIKVHGFHGSFFNKKEHVFLEELLNKYPYLSNSTYNSSESSDGEGSSSFSLYSSSSDSEEEHKNSSPPSCKRKRSD